MFDINQTASTGYIGPGYYRKSKYLNKNVHGGVISFRVGETFVTDKDIPGPGTYELPDNMQR